MTSLSFFSIEHLKSNPKAETPTVEKVKFDFFISVLNE